MILPVLLAQPSPSDDSNVNLDDERLQDEIPKGLQKVELDLDDALFLEFEEEEPPPQDASVEAEEVPASTAEEDKKRALRHGLPIWKRPSFLGLAMLLLLVVAASIFWLLSGSGPESENASIEQPKKIAPAPSVKPPASVAGSGQEGGGGARKTYAFQPFLVEHRRGERPQFLTVSFSIPGAPSSLVREMNTKNKVLRDAIFRFLQKEELIDPSNPDQENKFKTDLLAALNSALENGQVTDILIEGYVVK
jgi:flagellar FliL protein